MAVVVALAKVPEPLLAAIPSEAKTLTVLVKTLDAMSFGSHPEIIYGPLP